MGLLFAARDRFGEWVAQVALEGESAGEADTLWQGQLIPRVPMLV